MRRITKTEAKTLKTRPSGKHSYALGVLMSMKVGEVIILEPADWRQKKKQPRTFCLELGRKTGMGWTCETLMDGSGWVVERVK